MCVAYKRTHLTRLRATSDCSEVIASDLHHIEVNTILVKDCQRSQTRTSQVNTIVSTVTPAIDFS